MDIKPAASEDHSAIVALLEDAKLLADDLDPQLEHFFTASVDSRIVAAGGLEIYAENALLRSLVVMPEIRGQQVGARLYKKLSNYAEIKQVRQLYLLTETAESFFSAQGFETIARSNVPASIRSTQQFSDLCPDSATVMIKKL